MTVAQILAFYHETQSVSNTPCILDVLLLKSMIVDRGIQIQEALEFMYF